MFPSTFLMHILHLWYRVLQLVKVWITAYLLREDAVNVWIFQYTVTEPVPAFSSSCSVYGSVDTASAYYCHPL